VISRRAFVAGLTGGLLAAPLAAGAQQAGKVHRIGYLTVPSRESAQGVANTFSLGLRDLGWIEGQNVVVEYRFAASNLDRLSDLAAELVRLGSEVIVAGANAAVVAAKNATRTIPIVMFLTVDPVGSGQLPGMDGAEFYRRIEEQWPHLARRVASVTGRAPNDLAPRSGDASVPILGKPFSFESLQAAIATVLARAT